MSLLVSSAAWAQPGAPASELESLKQELQQLKRRTEELERKIQQYESRPGKPVGPVVAEPSTAPEPTVGDQAERGLTTGPGVPAGRRPWEGGPIAVFRSGSAYANLSFSSLLDAGWASSRDLGVLEPGGHDPVQRGFSLPNSEVVLDGAVDPYFKGFADIVFKLDQDNGTEVELEEAYLLSSSLPANLQLKAGQFFAEFGR